MKKRIIYDIKYINESFFIVFGLEGSGKSLFINALSGQETLKFNTHNFSTSETFQIANFVFKNHFFNAIEIPGCSGEYEDNVKLAQLKGLLNNINKIKKIILIKKYNEFRIATSIQKAIILFMNTFPRKQFWDNFIVVNTWANPHDELFIDYMEEDHENFTKIINNIDNLKDVMFKLDILNQSKIKEYFVDSKKIHKYKEIADEFDKIKEDIKNSSSMLKLNANIYSLSDYPIIKIEEIEEEIEEDNVKWYDVASLGIAKAIRNKKKCNIYEVKYYQFGDKIIKGEKIFKRVEMK